jgi:hypothetical protein
MQVGMNAEALARSFEQLGEHVTAGRDESATWRAYVFNRATDGQRSHDRETATQLCRQAGLLLPGGGGADPRAAWCDHLLARGRHVRSGQIVSLAFASAEALRDLASSEPPQARLRVNNDPKQPQVIIDGLAHSVKPEVANFLEALLAADGAYVKATKFGVRAARDLEKLPEALGNLIDSKPGVGFRLIRRP